VGGQFGGHRASSRPGRSLDKRGLDQPRLRITLRFEIDASDQWRLVKYDSGNC
jgi:hypothetical protein